MEIRYRIDVQPDIEQVVTLYEKAGLPRPVGDKERMQKMFNNSSLIITAWHNQVLVGVCRCITDWVWCCYLSDLAVHPDYKKSGIGKKLIESARKELGEKTMILLLSVPDAMEYYPKVGFIKDDRTFIINRTK